MRAKYSLCYSTGAVPNRSDKRITIPRSKHTMVGCCVTVAYTGRTCPQCKTNRWLARLYQSLIFSPKYNPKDELAKFLRAERACPFHVRPEIVPPVIEHVASRSAVNLRPPIGLTGFSRLGTKAHSETVFVECPGQACPSHGVPHSHKLIADCPGRDRFKLLTSYTTDVPRELGGFVGRKVRPTFGRIPALTTWCYSYAPSHDAMHQRTVNWHTLNPLLHFENGAWSIVNGTPSLDTKPLSRSQTFDVRIEGRWRRGRRATAWTTLPKTTNEQRKMWRRKWSDSTCGDTENGGRTETQLWNLRNWYHNLLTPERVPFGLTRKGKRNWRMARP